MKIIKNEPNKNKSSTNLKIVIFIISYSSIVFLAGAIFYRNGYFAKYQKYFFPFTKVFREKPFETIRNQLTKSTSLLIDINHENISKLKKIREKAVIQKELFPKDSKWVNAQISYGTEKYNAKIRLKGQLMDHWRDDGMWSYKIKLKEDKTLFGMDRFAIQHPRTRHFMNEWYYHKILDYVGLISLRYNFLPVVINGDNLPIYAIEENFSTRLLENNNKREGPIFRLQNRVSEEERYVNQVTFYQEQKYQNTKEGRYLLRRVERQIKSFLNGNIKASDVFDIDLMAKAYAIGDLFGNDHSILAYNIRYYLNPISGLIEPILYDQQEIKELSLKGLIGERNKHFEHSKIYPDNLISLLFKDNDFSEKYLQALDTFSNKNWLDEFFNKNQLEAKQILLLLQKSYLSYEFDHKQKLYSNQNYIRSKLRVRSPIEAYLVPYEKDDSIYLKIKNLHTLPLEIISLENFAGEKVTLDSKPTRLSNKLKICSTQKCYKEISNKEENFEYLKIPIKNKFIKSEDLNQLKIIGNVIGNKFSFSVPVYSNIEYNLGINNIDSLKKLNFLNIDDKKKIIIFKKGKISLNQSLSIPSGFRVRVLEGTTIDLIESASIKTKSPIDLIGSNELPIVIQTSDNTGEGLIVTNTKESTSTIKNVIFKGLKNISKYGLNTTGAITFYDSNVNIDSVKFLSIMAEDTLNIVNSNFSILNSEFYDSLSDAVDIDFSNGEMRQLKLVNIGNDALDFSGSNSRILNITIENSGDKGISVGENSELNVKDIKIKKSFIGLAIKDDSVMKGNEIKIKNSYVGVANYNKKSWFKGGNTELNDVNIKESQNKYFNEEGSFMLINNEEVIPNQKNLFNKLYSN